MKKNLTLLLSLLFLVVSSCTCHRQKPEVQTPEDVVRKFVEMSGSIKEVSQKEQLTKLCTGDMRRAFERMTDDSFKLTYVNQNIRIKNIKILEKDIKPEAAKITYEVRLENFQGTSPTEETNEREVELQLVDHQWLIKYVLTKGSDKLAFTRGMIF